MKRTVLIDGDILAYQLASTHEEAHTFGDETFYDVDLDGALREIGNAVEWIIDTTESQAAAVFLTGTDNFRKDFYPQYKANRLDVRKPALLPHMRQWLMDNTRCFMEDRLEGDDLIGIHATMPHKGERVIYSADKDLKTVPGLHWDNEDAEVYRIDREEAIYRFLSQVITGDPVDGYPGCPGAGPAEVAKTLGVMQSWESYSHTFKRGPRRGKSITRWELVDNDSQWDIVLSIYEKAGLLPEDALTQARCAYILQDGDFEFDTKEVRPWSPTLLVN